jgi:hypothetical protein
MVKGTTGLSDGSPKQQSDEAPSGNCPVLRHKDEDSENDFQNAAQEVHDATARTAA